MVEGSAKDIKLLTRREVLKTPEPHGLYFILPLVCTPYTFITVLPLQAWRNNKCVIALQGNNGLHGRYIKFSYSLGIFFH